MTRSEPKTKAASPALALWSWCPGPEPCHTALPSRLLKTPALSAVSCRSHGASISLPLLTPLGSYLFHAYRIVIVPINDPVPGLLWSWKPQDRTVDNA